MPFHDFISLLSVPPGDLVYHLVTLFAIQLILGMAAGHLYRRRDDSVAVRLAVMAGGITAARAALMLVAMLARLGWLSPDVVLPPLERFLDLLTPLLAAWAFLPLSQQDARIGTAVLLVTSLIAAGGYAAFATLWPAVANSVPYNLYWQAQAWEAASAALMLIFLIVGLAVRGEDWPLLTALFVVWFVAHLLELGLPDPESHIAGWVRTANLAAYPLLAALVYRHILRSRTPPPAVEVRRAGGVDLTAVDILDATNRIERVADIEPGLRLAAPAIARALEADMVAIGLVAGGRSARRIRLVALHPSTGALLGEQETFISTSRHPLLATALQTGRVQRSVSPQQDTTITDLYRRLGFEQAGPLLVYPLMDGETARGLIIAGNPISQKEWRTHTRRTFRAVGAAVAMALRRVYRQAEAERDDALQKAINEAHRMAQRAQVLEAELENQRRRAEELATRLRLQEHDAARQGQAAETAILKKEIRKLTEESTRRQAELEAELTRWKEKAEQLALAQEEIGDRATLEAELVKWREKAKQLGRLTADLQAKLSQTQAQLEAVRDRLAQQPPAAPPAPAAGLTANGILVSDEEGNIILATRGARHLIGQLRTALEGVPLQSLFPDPSWGEAVNRLLSDAAQAGDAATVLVHLDGQVVQAELTRIPTIDGGLGALAVTFSQEERSAVEQNEMLLSLIHELRTPMTSITGYTDLLLGESVGILGETQRQFLRRVRVNVERMERLLDDLVRVSALDAGQIPFAPESVDLGDVIEEAVMSLSNQFRDRQLAVRLRLPEELPAIHADRDGLYQVMSRLLSNACQCSQPGTEVLVEARLEKYDDPLGEVPDYVFVSVSDTGGGIAPEDQRRVFQRFYRANNPLIEGLGDTGVGLSLAKALVESQGGRIWVESKMGVGSTFSFILPLEPPAAQERQ